MKNKVSIIVPIFNNEKHLKKCIDSLINQTYENIEIFLINDGSTDKSLEICNLYNNDKRIIIINKKNEGVSSSRNVGVEKATGEYITFVDSDDWLEKDCIEKCMDKGNGYDLIFFPYIREYPNKSLERRIFEKDQIFETQKEVYNRIYKKFIGPNKSQFNDPSTIECNNAVWGKLYKTSIIKKVKFVDYKILFSEDLLFNIEVTQNIHNAIYLSFVHYHYNKENKSSLTNINCDNVINRWKKLYELIKIQINYPKNKELSELLDNRIALSILGIFQQTYINNRDDNYLKKIITMKKILSDDLYSNRLKKLHYNNMQIKWKVFYFCCKHKLCILLSIMLEVIKKYKRK